ncbi:MAG TPA: GNAT family N-acetyltransferase [Verrucomicrobiae bacterium]|nr:GNAT family N-acetyltransferase [Verrucomicrobiae bacterium]
MAVQFTTRKMSPADADRLREIAALSFSRFMAFFAVHSLFSDEGEVLVSEAEGKAVGFAKLIEFQLGPNKLGCLLWIAVHSDFRRNGVASALITEGIKRLKQDGAKAVFASTQRRNSRALNVLSRNGFRRMGFLQLWRIFSWRLFEFYGDIWLAPGEIVLMHD